MDKARHIFFSAVMPVYNCGRYVVEAIESMLAQGRDDLEVIVVDDGSTDDTLKKLFPFKDRVKIMTEDNKGPAAARNRGIEAARGEWIAFQDCDDRWLPGHLDRLERAVLENPGAAMVYSDAMLIDEEGAEIKKKRAPGPGRDFFLTVLMDNTVSTPAVCVRREVLVSAGMFYPPLRSAQDWDMWLRIGYGYKVVHVPEITVQCRRRQESTMHTRGVSTGMRDDNLLVMQRVAKMAPELDPALLRKATARRYLESAERMVVAYDTRGARKELMQAIKRCPASAGAWLMLLPTLGGPMLARALVSFRRWQEKRF